jgi:hypothetical protein
MIGALRSFVLGVAIGLPSRAIWLPRRKRDHIARMRERFDAR